MLEGSASAYPGRKISCFALEKLYFAWRKTYQANNRDQFRQLQLIKPIVHLKTDLLIFL